jgi:predicted lipoprotein with Yx(FWY)xxD motif
MTERQDMTRLTTVSGAGRAAREHAGRTAPGWPAVILRVAGSGLLIATAAIHLDLYLTGYRTIPTIGWLFLLQVIAAFGLGLAVLAIPSRLVIASRLAAAAGAGFALATLGGYLLSVWTGLFGFKEVRTTAGIVAGVVEVVAFVVLAALALAPAAANAPADGTAAAPARFPARIPPAAARAAGITAAGLAVAALVLFGLVVAGASSPAPAATATGTGTGTGTVLKTTTIGGTTVLTNAKGFTLYSFAPDTPAASKCYGSCAVYWPPVTGTAAASPGVPGRIGTIKRTDGSEQLTYNGHPLYTYIADTAPGQARGNNINLNGGVWHEVPASR